MQRHRHSLDISVLSSTGIKRKSVIKTFPEDFCNNKQAFLLADSWQHPGLAIPQMWEPQSMQASKPAVQGALIVHLMLPHCQATSGGEQVGACDRKLMAFIQNHKGTYFHLRVLFGQPCHLRCPAAIADKMQGKLRIQCS
jgi:hypothetical protein